MRRKDNTMRRPRCLPRKSFHCGSADDMAEDERVMVLCLNVLRWLGLSFTRIRRSPPGGFIASDSRSHLLVNVIIGGVLVLVFCFAGTGATAETAGLEAMLAAYEIYTKLSTFIVAMILFCGNVHNRKFIDIIHLFCRVMRELEQDVGRLGRKKDKGGCRILLGFCVYLGASTAAQALWLDTYLPPFYNRTFRIIHYLSYGYVTLFTAHFVVTMNYIRVKFKHVNATFKKVVVPSALEASAPTRAFQARRRLRAWMAAFLDLREAEGLVNEIFGKQVFLTMILAVSRVILNAYFLVTFNMRGASTSSFNAILWLGLLQAVTMVLLSTTAVELTTNEVNKINDIIFHFPVHLQDWQMFDQVQYFTLFSHSYPVQFKVWILHAISYDSLLKVMLTSSAVTVIILQCDFLEINFWQIIAAETPGEAVQHQGRQLKVLDK